MANGQSSNLIDTALDWSLTPPVERDPDLHDQGGQKWKYNELGVLLVNSNAPLRTQGNPDTINAILASYGREIHSASIARQIPPELIVMTIATETAFLRNANFTGPKSFRWEKSVTSYSGGPMQVLETTARQLIKDFNLAFDQDDIPPHFSVEPPAHPTDNPLYNGDVSVPLGTAYIRQNKDNHATGLDPILVSACYNAGRLKQTTPTTINPWGLVTTLDHLSRAAEWYGDACFVIGQLRGGQQLNTSTIISQPPEVDPEDTARQTFVRRGLTRDEATDQTNDFHDSGANVIEAPEEGGTFTIIVSFPQVVADPTPPPPPPPPAAGAIAPPQQNGFVICIDRKATQLRPNKGFRRTIGVYQAFFDKQPILELHGTAVERQGPGDNTNTGVQRHSRLAQGQYPLFTHAGGKNKYRTFGFANPGGLQSRPWPSIRVGNTNARSGVLIHCAAGYLMSIGCINLSGRALKNPTDDIEYFDSRSRVIGLIQAMQARLGAQFPSSNNAKIPNAVLEIRGEP